jgi:hypothetical protein
MQRYLFQNIDRSTEMTKYLTHPRVNALRLRTLKISRYAMRIISPTPHFVAFSQAVLYRGADLPIVWPLLAAMAVKPQEPRRP